MILSSERLTGLLTFYPPEKQHALAVFQDIQKLCGYLPKEHIVEASRYLGLPLAQAYAMATFYHAFSLKPRGKYVIKVCDGTACHLRGSKLVLETLRQLLSVDLGGTDPEGLFTVEGVACLGACALAPVMQIGDEYFGHLDEEKVAEIIADFRQRDAAERAVNQVADITAGAAAGVVSMLTSVVDMLTGMAAGAPDNEAEVSA